MKMVRKPSVRRPSCGRNALHRARPPAQAVLTAGSEQEHGHDHRHHARSAGKDHGCRALSTMVAASARRGLIRSEITPYASRSISLPPP